MASFKQSPRPARLPSLRWPGPPQTEPCRGVLRSEGAPCNRTAFTEPSVPTPTPPFHAPGSETFPLPRAPGALTCSHSRGVKPLFPLPLPLRPWRPALPQGLGLPRPSPLDPPPPRKCQAPWERGRGSSFPCGGHPTGSQPEVVLEVVDHRCARSRPGHDISPVVPGVRHQGEYLLEQLDAVQDRDGLALKDAAHPGDHP